MHAPPPGWEGITATLEALRANYRELGGFLDRQWDELEALRGELDRQERELEHRGRQLDSKEEEIAAQLQLAETYKQLADVRCELLRQPGDGAGEIEGALTASLTRIDEFEHFIVSLRETIHRRADQSRLG